MKGLKRMLVLLAGTVMFLCAGPVWAYNVINIEVPYAQHGGDWWSGLALTNTGPEEMMVSIMAYQSGKEVALGEVYVPARSQSVRMLPEFFTIVPYPTDNEGRVYLWVRAYGTDIEKYCKFTLFMGSSEGFAFESYDGRDSIENY